MNPEDVVCTELVLGKHSGRMLRQRIRELAITSTTLSLRARRLGAGPIERKCTTPTSKR